MKTTLLFFLTAAALALAGSRLSQIGQERARKAETFELCIAQMEKDAALLPAASLATVNATRSNSEALQAQLAGLQQIFHENAAARSTTLRAVKLQEASAKKAETSLAPSLRPLFQPLPADAPAQTVTKRQCESAFLESLLAAGIEDIDFLALAETGKNLPGLAGKTASLQMRIRARLLDLSRWMSRMAAAPQTLPLHRLERLEIKPLSGESPAAHPSYLIDLNVEIVLP